MYVPAAFAETDLPALHAALRAGGLATLVTMGEAGLEASHVPMLFEPEPTPLGTLVGHIARANPQWQRAAAGTEALAIFLGPDAYVSPAWYKTKKRDGKVVPTWNYVAIHAYGAIEWFDDAERLRRVVGALTLRHETGRPDPWSMSDAPEEYLRGMLRAIVGFRLSIVRIEGKRKMSQNRPEEDRAAVAAAFDAAGRADLAALVKGAR